LPVILRSISISGYAMMRDGCRDEPKNEQKTANSDKHEFAVMDDFSSRKRW